MMSLFNSFVIEHSMLAIPNASYNKGSEVMGGAFDLPTQIMINNIIVCVYWCWMCVMCPVQYVHVPCACAGLLW